MAKAMTTQNVAISEESKEIRKAQANYQGNDILDLVEVTIEKDGKHYKKGDKDIVHPTTAEILKAKGLISSYKKVDRDAINKAQEKASEEYIKSLQQ